MPKDELNKYFNSGLNASVNYVKKLKIDTKKEANSNFPQLIDYVKLKSLLEK